MQKARERSGGNRKNDVFLSLTALSRVVILAAHHRLPEHF